MNVAALTRSMATWSNSSTASGGPSCLPYVLRMVRLTFSGGVAADLVPVWTGNRLLGSEAGEVTSGTAEGYIPQNVLLFQARLDYQHVIQLTK